MLVNEAEGKADRRVRRTLKHLQQAFGELLSEKDFHSITVQDIVGRADVNRATFYAHFTDKFALLSYTVREALRERLEHRLLDTGVFTLTNVRLLTVAVCEFLGQFYGRCHPNTRANGQQAILIAAVVQQHIYGLLLEWISAADGDAVSPAIPAERAAAALSWLIFGTALEAKRLDQKLSPEQLADQMLAFLAPSLQNYSAKPASQ